MISSQGPHQGQPLHHRGQSIDKAKAAMIMIHGRGADGQSLLSLVAEFNNPHYAYLAPDAAKNIIETIGLNRTPRRDSGARIVTEPVSVSVLPGRQAIVVVASPADRDTVVALVKSLDAAPDMAASEVRVVQL